MQWAGNIVAISIQHFKLTWQLVQPANSPKEEGCQVGMARWFASKNLQLAYIILCTKIHRI